jgi:cytoskeleton protein RodZ
MTSFESAMPETVRGIGEKLRQARIRAGLTPAEAGARLKIQTHVIEALEREDWAKLGAAVFVRGQLRSYARLLGLPVESITESPAVPAARAADLVPQTYTPRMQRVAEQTGRRLVYVLITAVIAVPVWLATRSHLSPTVAPVSLDADTSLSLPQPLAAAPDASTSAAQPAAAVPAEQAPLVASMAPMPVRAAAPAATDMAVSFSGESWVRLVAPDGSEIEKGLIPAGQQRAFKPGQIGEVVLGNAQAVTVRYQGRTLDLTPYIRANVVRFTVSSDGSLQPVDR